MEIIEQSHQILFPENLKSCEYDIYKMIEVAGRTAYKSEELITDDSCIKFIQNIIKRGHESVLEHFNIQVKFITDRGVTHEIVRHRLVSYTQESTRYCNYNKKGVTIIKPVFWNENTSEYCTWKNQMIMAEQSYNTLISFGATP